MSTQNEAVFSADYKGLPKKTQATKTSSTKGGMSKSTSKGSGSKKK